MASSARIESSADSPRRSPFENDPPPKTRYDLVADIDLLRLRHYEPEKRIPGGLPVMLIYSLFKRPFILDLEEQRSVVQCFLRRGFSVYLVDWRAPAAKDAANGLEDYINDGLAHAVNRVCEREGVEQVSLVGICLGGLLSLLYTALHPGGVARLVQVAVGIEQHRFVPPAVIEQMIAFYGNLPAWWIRGAVNSRVPGMSLLPQFLAEEFDEPQLAERERAPRRLFGAFEQWLNSDVPLAGQLARDIFGAVYWEGQLAEGRLHVGGRRVDLDRVVCPLLNVSGARDQLVPPQRTTTLVKRVGSDYARNLVYPASHIGLLGAQAAHQDLWPRVSTWLRLFDAQATY